MQRRSRSFSNGRFRRTITGTESFLQINRNPLGIICLARTYIRPGDSWLIYALPQSIFRYIKVQSHSAWKKDIRVTADMRASICIRARKGVGIAHNLELVYAPAGLLHAFSEARSAAPDSQLHSSSGSHDPRLPVVKVPHSIRQDPEHPDDRITSIPNRASLGSDGICAPVSTIPQEKGRSSIHPPSDNSRQNPDLSISHDQMLSAVREPHPTRQDPEHPVDRMAFQLGSSTRFIQIRSFPRRQSDMLTADIARRGDNGGISIRAPWDLKVLKPDGKVMERANISLKSDFPKLVLSKMPNMNQSDSFSQPASARELVYPLMAQVVRQQPHEASAQTWHSPSFSGERAQDLAEAPRGFDLNRLAERVYTIIERRTKIEMERRGLYSRS